MICDLAETYHIYDYKKLPPTLISVYVEGLSKDSRVSRKIAGVELPLVEHLLVYIFDQLNIILWSKTKDAQKGKNIPAMLSKTLKLKENKEEIYYTSEDFLKERKRLLEGGGI